MDLMREMKCQERLHVRVVCHQSTDQLYVSLFTGGKSPKSWVILYTRQITIQYES